MAPVRVLDSSVEFQLDLSAITSRLSEHVEETTPKADDGKGATEPNTAFCYKRFLLPFSAQDGGYVLYAEKLKPLVAMLLKK